MPILVKIKMNLIRCILIIFASFISPLYAAGEPLNVAIDSFTPPFEMQGANHEVFGYDIDVMNSLCAIMGRTCQYHIMRFNQLLPAVVDKKVDVAISSITITAERSELINFSLPYLLSYSRFLSNHSTDLKQSFTLDLLNNKTIGIEEGTIFTQQIKDMGIKNTTIKEYRTVDLLLEGLSQKKVDFILVDNATAVYWGANSSGAFTVVGSPLLYGNGYGIAVNKINRQLLQSINSALLQYQNSNEYKINYNKYLTDI